MNEKITIFVFLIFGVTGIFVLIGCQDASTAIVHNASGIDGDSIEEPSRYAADAITGRVFENSQAEWISSEVKIGPEVSILHFVDEMRGWAIGRNEIYTTSDGGNAWRMTRFNIQIVGDGDTIEQLVFGNDGVGWLVVQHNEGDGFSLKDQVRVYRGSDGGTKWTLSTVQASATFSDLHLAGRDVWLIGRTFPDKEPSQLLPLILRFSYEKRGWDNISSNFKAYPKGEGDELHNHPRLSKIGISDTGCVIVVAEERSVYQTCDEGKHWKLTNRRGHGPDRRLSINYLNIANGIARLVEASGGIEGTGTALTTWDLSNGKTVKSIVLSSYFLTWAFWISENRIMVVGERKGIPVRDADENEHKDRSVILETVDGGNTWVEVFSKAFDNTLGAFFLAGQQTIWLIDERGKTYKITRRW